MLYLRLAQELPGTYVSLIISAGEAFWERRHPWGLQSTTSRAGHWFQSSWVSLLNWPRLGLPSRLETGAKRPGSHLSWAIFFSSVTLGRSV